MLRRLVYRRLPSFAVAGAAIAVACAVGCASSVQPSVPTGGQADVPENYPMTIVESAEHRDSMTALWQRLFETYGVPADRRKVPDLQPFTHTPQSILGIGPISLAGSGGAPVDDERVRQLVRDFIGKNAELLGVNAADLSLDNVMESGKLGKRFTFVQTSYSYPIVRPAGVIELMVTPAGDLIQLTDTAIPVADLPSQATVTAAQAESRVIGTTFTYGDIAGRPQSVIVSDPKAVSAKRLVVYADVGESALRIWLAWEVEAGTSLSWTVYVDAVTGKIVSQRQNFQT